MLFVWKNYLYELRFFLKFGLFVNVKNVEMKSCVKEISLFVKKKLILILSNKKKVLIRVKIIIKVFSEEGNYFVMI